MGMGEDYDYDINEDERTVTCKFCGQRGLHWKHIFVRSFQRHVYRLFDENHQQHFCLKMNALINSVKAKQKESKSVQSRKTHT